MNGKKMVKNENRRAVFHLEMAEEHLRFAAAYLCDVVANLPTDMARTAAELSRLADAIKEQQERIADSRREKQKELDLD